MNKSFKYKHTIGKESTYPKDMPSEHSNLPVWNSENWFYEDVIIDHKIRSLRRTISEGEAMQFNCMVLDMHPYVGDEHFAKNEGLFKKRLVAKAVPNKTITTESILIGDGAFFSINISRNTPIHTVCINKTIPIETGTYFTVK